MAAEPQGAERRQHVRVKRNFIVRFCQKGNFAHKYEVSQVENVSKGGLCFTSTLIFKPGDVLIAELRTPYISDTIILEGVVLSCQDKVKGLIYQIRIQFQDINQISAEILDKIEKYNSKVIVQ